MSLESKLDTPASYGTVQAFANPRPTPGIAFTESAPLKRPRHLDLTLRVFELMRTPSLRCPNGQWTWCTLRQRLGGKVGGRQLRQVLESLIHGGYLVEAWEGRRGAQQPRHFFIAQRNLDSIDLSGTLRFRGTRAMLRKLPLKDFGMEIVDEIPD